MKKFALQKQKKQVTKKIKNKIVRKKISPSENIFNKYNNFEKLPNIYYINLKHREDRKKNFEKTWESIMYPSSKIIRIEAIKNEIGTLGCLASHIKALNLALNTENGLDYAIILEDDFIFKPELDKKTIQNTLLDCFKTNEEWNVILLAMNGKSKENLIVEDKNNFKIKMNGIIENNKYIENTNKLLLKINYSITTSGYIIKKKYIPVLLNLWEKLYEKTKNSKSIPSQELHMDVYWCKLQHDKWFVTNPKLGIQYESYSDIEKRITNYGV